jgi:transposase-like protein
MKLMRANHRRLLFTIGTDKHASYPEAFAASVEENVLPKDCKLRRVKYLNNIIEQEHRAICEEEASDAMFPPPSYRRADFGRAHMMRKGRAKGFDGWDTRGRAKFIASLFGVVA